MRTRARYGPALLAAGGLALGIVALWRPAVQVADGPGHRLLVELPDWVKALVAGAAVLEFLVILLLLIPTPGRKKRRATRPKRPAPTRMSPAALIALLLPSIVMSVVGFVSIRYLDRDLLARLFGGLRSLPDWALTDGTGARHEAVSLPLVNFGVSFTVGIAAALLAACCILIIVLHPPWSLLTAWLRHTRPPRSPPLAAEIVSAFAAGRRELAAGDDPRSAVIACYRQCEATLASRRRRRRVSETPREFLRDALAAMQLPALAIGALLGVFERARFSDLPVTQRDRATALEALDEICRELERRREDGAHA